jgi:hypothetical protein
MFQLDAPLLERLSLGHRLVSIQLFALQFQTKSDLLQPLLDVFIEGTRGVCRDRFEQADKDR